MHVFDILRVIYGNCLSVWICCKASSQQAPWSKGYGFKLQASHVTSTGKQMSVWHTQHVPPNPWFQSVTLLAPSGDVVVSRHGLDFSGWWSDPMTFRHETIQSLNRPVIWFQMMQNIKNDRLVYRNVQINQRVISCDAIWHEPKYKVIKVKMPSYYNRSFLPSPPCWKKVNDLTRPRLSWVRYR